MEYAKIGNAKILKFANMEMSKCEKKTRGCENAKILQLDNPTITKTKYHIWKMRKCENAKMPNCKRAKYENSRMPKYENAKYE